MEQNAKQQVVESIKNASNVLVTVSRDPNVDELSAALGFTLILNKLEKHATSLVSGKVPHTMEFLDPQKTFENSVDSLRDFIISLDKNKADKLRYKVEDDVVKIYVTPYKTQITKEDVQFSQGDYNVDVVVALGVGKRDDLDESLKAHGRILHDATILTINTGSKQSGIGSVNWQDPQASSICEMLVSISEAFQGGLLDEQISTAFLTGIIAATNRFSSQNTTPKIMTMAAQLMATGANQQLIANNLQSSDLLPQANGNAGSVSSGTGGSKSDELKLIHEDEASKEPAQDIPQMVSKSPDPEPKFDIAKPSIEYTPPANVPLTTPVKKDEALASQKIAELEEQLHAHQQPVQPAEPTIKAQPALISKPKGFGSQDIAPSPLLGGTFNATATAAQNAKEEEKFNPLNKTVLSHSSTGLIHAEQKEPEQSLPKTSVPEFSSFNQPAPLQQPVNNLPSPPEPNTNSPSVDLESIRREVEEAVGSAPSQTPPSLPPAPAPSSFSMPQQSPALPSAVPPLNVPVQPLGNNIDPSKTFQIPSQPTAPGLTPRPYLDNNQVNTNLPPPPSSPPPTF